MCTIIVIKMRPIVLHLTMDEFEYVSPVHIGGCRQRLRRSGHPPDSFFSEDDRSMGDSFLFTMNYESTEKRIVRSWGAVG